MMGHRSLAVGQAKEVGSLVEYWAGFRVSSSQERRASALYTHAFWGRVPFLQGRSWLLTLARCALQVLNLTYHGGVARQLWWG